MKVSFASTLFTLLLRQIMERCGRDFHRLYIRMGRSEVRSSEKAENVSLFRCRSETVRKAWALIVAFIIEKIKLGHHDQVSEPIHISKQSRFQRKAMLSQRASMSYLESVPIAHMKLS